MNLIEEIQQELARNREILALYEDIPQGAFGAIMIKQTISKAEQSIAGGDCAAMVLSLKELKETK